MTERHIPLSTLQDKHFPLQSLSRTLTLMDKTKKKSMSGLAVFSAAIKYLKNYALKELRKKGSQVNEDEITWVLTVPAIWNDGSRQFMREAATKVDCHGFFFYSR